MQLDHHILQAILQFPQPPLAIFSIIRLGAKLGNRDSKRLTIFPPENVLR